MFILYTNQAVRLSSIPKSIASTGTRARIYDVVGDAWRTYQPTLGGFDVNRNNPNIEIFHQVVACE